MEYLWEEGFETPDDMQQIPMERIQVVPPVIIKASWVKGKDKQNLRVSSSAATSNKEKEGPSPYGIKDFIDLCDMEE